MRSFITLFLFLVSISAFAQEQLSLFECYQTVNKNYPLVRQKALVESQHTIDLDVLNTEKFPQINLSAQATYQSDVTEVPIPNSSIEPLNKDQYRATATINQLIYGGGIVNASIDARTTALKTQQKQIEVNLYRLKDRVNHLYFSLLLLQERRQLLVAKKEQLESKLKEVKSGIDNGILLPASDKVLEVELLKIVQQFIEIDQNKISLFKTLSSLMLQDIPYTITLKKPEILIDLTTKINRPELELFQLQKNSVEASEIIISKNNSPKLIGFATGGYGNPGLNMLDNSFQAFYMVGAQLNWNIFDWNATKKKRNSLSINKDLITNETELFELNTRIALNKLNTEIEKITSFIESDTEIIKLRKELLKTADSQLRNGVITSSDYIEELTHLFEAENALNTHKIQLLLAKANYNITQGN